MEDDYNVIKCREYINNILVFNLIGHKKIWLTYYSYIYYLLCFKTSSSCGQRNHEKRRKKREEERIG
jgi:hypothetical protein